MVLNLMTMGVGLLVAACISIVLVVILLKVVKKVIVKIILILLNSIAGIILLLILVYIIGVQIPVNIYTLAITAIFGLAGIGTLLLLHFGGMV